MKNWPFFLKCRVADNFLMGFLPVMPLYAILFVAEKSVSRQQLGVLFMLWSFAFLAAEIPSGLFADYISRKYALSIAGFLRAAGFLLWLIFPHFTGYLVGFIFWGFAIAFNSGVEQAYIHNELKVINESKRYSKFLGITGSANLLGLVGAYLVASLAGPQHFEFLLVVSITTSLLGAVVSLLPAEHPWTKRSSYFETWKAALKIIKVSKPLQFICFTMLLVYMTIGTLEEYVPRLHADFGRSPRAIPLIILAANLVGAIVVTQLHRYVILKKQTVYLLLCLGVGVLLGGLKLGGVAGSFLLFGFVALFSLQRSVFQYFIQHYTDSDERATVNSIPSTVAGLLGFVNFGIGYVSQRQGEVKAIFLYSSLLFVLYVALLLVQNRYIGGVRETR